MLVACAINKPRSHEADTLDAFFTKIKLCGYATEADYDSATDALATDTTTKTDIIAYWQSRIKDAQSDPNVTKL